ncbi:MAG TPA: winged helix-turn-helix domain-containing protein [Gammaproteobacteria bacterium]|jgi:two-component system phosphate regulon response regulator PhoB
MGDTIFLIHDSKPLRETTRKYLEDTGYVVMLANDLPAASSRIDAAAPALILLQWTDAAATEAAVGQLKAGQETRASRIILIAAEDAIGAAIAALEYGADDCLTVRFTAEELVGRVNACFRRPPTVTRRDRIRAGPLLLDRVAHRLFVSEDCVELAPTEFRLIEFFIEHHGRAFSRQELLQHAWPKNVKAGRRTVDVNVRRLRQALEPYACDHMIQTVRGFGYRFSLEERAIGARQVAAAAAFSRP